MNTSMKDGICSSCKSKEVYAQERGFEYPGNIRVVTTNRRFIDPFNYSTATIDFVCVNCGYFENYISDKNTLIEISNTWQKVKVIE
jgi:phosphopantothenoylcysteine synthetase/decarboxylase